MRQIVIPIVLLILSVGCGKSDNDQAEANDEIVSEKLQINGSLENGLDPDNSDILSGRTVNIVRNDGKIVGTSEAGDNGSFQIEVAEGELVSDGGYALAESDEATSEAEFSYRLEATVPDDGNGKALGVRKNVALNSSSVASQKDGVAKIDLGVNSVKEISAIIGTVSFADQVVSKSDVDVFIPGKSFFLKTGDDGDFNLLFIPEGEHTVRISKGVYRKDIAVTVEAGVTSNLGDVEVSLDERDPQPLADVLIGRWNTTCRTDVSGSDPETAFTGTLTITSLTDFASTGDSCLLSSMSGTHDFTSMIVPNDGVLILKDTQSVPDDFTFNYVLGYTNERIVINVDFGASQGGVEVLERISD